MIAWRAGDADNDVEIASSRVAISSLRRHGLSERDAGAYPVGSVYFGSVSYLYSTFSSSASTGGVLNLEMQV